MRTIYPVCVSIFFIAAALLARPAFASSELDAQKVRAKVEEAAALVAQSDEVKFTWGRTHDMLDKAEKALENNDLDDALHLANVVVDEASQAIAQQKRNAKNWILFVPK